MTPLTVLALAGTLVVIVGGALSAWSRGLVVGLAVQAAGMVAMGAAGTLVFLGAPSIGAGFANGAGIGLGVDELTGFFLLTLAVTGVPALVYAIGYLPKVPNATVVGPLTAAFILALAGVLSARTVLTLLTFWELMTLLPAGAILVTRHEPAARRSVYQYLAITHLGGTGVWVALLLLASKGGLTDPAALRAAGTGVQALIAVAAIVGFGTKAGLVPFHSWLPQAHPIAPSHISALMSGVMLKVALYGLIRVLFEWLPIPPVWVAVLVLGLGAVSAVLGVVYALFQHELKRLLAFHSIENMGIIVLGLGASLLFRNRGDTTWAELAFAAALLHTLNHAVFKGLLFLGAGSFDRAVHGLDLDRLGGLLRRMPWTAGAFLIGAMAIAGLPPLNGFASEWLTLQSLLHVTTGAAAPEAGTISLGGTAMGTALAGALATAALAMTAALAVYCFAKVGGLALLGPARRPAVAAAREVARPMVVGTSILAVLCVVLGVMPGLLVPRLAVLLPVPAGIASNVATATVAAPVAAAPVAGGLGIAAPGTGGLPSPGIAVLLVVFTGALLAVKGRRRAAAAPVWNCGQKIVPDLLWTSAGFTKPLRLVLEAALRPTRAVQVDERNGVLQRLTYRGSVPHLFDTALYGPIRRVGLAGATVIRRLQSGNLGDYVAYLLVLVILLLLAARLGLLG